MRDGRAESQEAEEVHTKLRLNRSLQTYASGEVLCLQWAYQYVEATRGEPARLAVGKPRPGLS